MKKLITVVAATAFSAAQTVGPTAVAPHPEILGAPQTQAGNIPSPRRAIATAGPLLGYTTAAAGSGITPIAGSGTLAELGGSLVLPIDAGQIYLPPRQMYAFIERPGRPMSLLRLDRNAPLAADLPLLDIPGAMANADQVFFSPLGHAAVLYSSADARLQVITGMLLPESHLRELSTAAVGEFSQLAVSDDGAVAVFSAARGASFALDGHGWEALPVAMTATAWSFLPRSHKLVVYDQGQQGFAVVRMSAHDTLLEKIVPASSIAPKSLLPAKDGMQILAVSAQGRTWVVDLARETVRPEISTARPANVALLRDGQTFLLSSTPSVSLVKVFDQTRPSSEAGQ